MEERVFSLFFFPFFLFFLQSNKKLMIDNSLGNCPKYLNKRHIKPAISKPKLLSTSTHLSPHALQLINKADLFFISSANNNSDMDTNHRGGPTGFLRVASNNDENNSESATVLCWPEYSGNRLYQTLGNLAIYPKAGLCIPDFDTGDCLYLSGTTEILVGSAAEEFLPHSNLCVKFFVVALRLVEHALPFRGVLGEKSIYHPRVRRLAKERFAASASAATTTGEQQQQQQATLLHQTKLTPTISRFRFRLHQPNTTSPTAAATYQPGQYITLDFSSHLHIGYSHMRDDDPRSLNDDFVRTFTVSGFYQHQQQQQQDQQKEEALGKCGDEFEITIRKVGGGIVTNFLFGYGDDDDDELYQNQYKGEKEKGKEHLVIDVRGFGGGGGEFTLQQQEEQEQEQQKNTPTRIPTEKEREEKRRIFIAAGIGITPIIPFLSTSSSSSSSLNLNLKILWTVKMEDLAFVWDVVGKVAELELQLDKGQEGLSKKKKKKGKGIKFVVFVTSWKNQHTDDDDNNNNGKKKEEKNAKAIINRLRPFPEIVDAVYFRRMGLDDMDYFHRHNNDEKEEEKDEREEKKQKEEKEISTKYYLCTGEKMKREVMGWLSEEGGEGGGGGEKEVVVVEDFTF